MIIEKSLEYQDREFTQLNLSAADLSQTEFENCIFVQCQFSATLFNKARFISCKWIACDLSNAIFKNSRMRDIYFQECKLVGIQWVQLDDFMSPVFDTCNLSYCNFSGMKLKKTKILNSNLKEVDFSRADLSESSFQKSDLLNAVFSETNLIKSNFCESYNYLIDPIQNKIRGAHFSMPEAQGLLAGLGIVID